MIQKVLTKIQGSSEIVKSYRSVGGGCINQCYQVTTNRRTYFMKYNVVRYLDMFKKEFQGLTALRKNCPLLVPKPLAFGECDQSSFLLMEFIESSQRSSEFWENLGMGLAEMHRQTHPLFGWETDNYIGKLPQTNSRHKSWISFFISERLQPQIKAAVDSGIMPDNIRRDFDIILGNLPQILIEGAPAFLHGDLWSGNVMIGPTGEPCLMDPAVYYGHREIELAFTRLFGGFDPRCYDAYQNMFDLEADYLERFDLYNLYPLLVHLNLFGSGYLSSIRHTLNRFV